MYIEKKLTWLIKYAKKVKIAFFLTVFSNSHHFLQFFLKFQGHIRIEHERLYRSIYITHWIKKSLEKKLAYISWYICLCPCFFQFVAT
jgi:hypothetical protein